MLLYSVKCCGILILVTAARYGAYASTVPTTPYCAFGKSMGRQLDVQPVFDVDIAHIANASCKRKPFSRAQRQQFCFPLERSIRSKKNVEHQIAGQQQFVADDAPAEPQSYAFGEVSSQRRAYLFATLVGTRAKRLLDPCHAVDCQSVASRYGSITSATPPPFAHCQMSSIEAALA